MRLILDDTECPFEGNNIGDAVSAGAAIADEQQRIVVEVMIDGEAWSDDQLNDISEHEGGADEVRLISANPVALVHEAFGDAITALEQANAIQQEAARQIQADEFSSAMESLGAAMEIWQTVHRAVLEGTNLLSFNLDAVQVGEQDAATIVGSLADQLKVIQESLSGQDPVGLSDALAYELPDVVGQWCEMIQKMRTHMEVDCEADDAGA